MTGGGLDRAGVRNVAGYIEAQFGLVKPFPQPNMLHGPRALIQYRLWEEKREREGAKGEWWLQARSEHAHILSRIGVFGRDRTRDLLLSATAPYSPLFRAAGLLRLGDRPEAFPPGLLDGARRILAVGSAAAAFREWKVLDDREMTILRGG